MTVKWVHTDMLDVKQSFLSHLYKLLKDKSSRTKTYLISSFFDGDMYDILIGCFLLYNLFFVFSISTLKPFYRPNIIIIQTKAVGHNDCLAILLRYVYGNISYNFNLLTYQQDIRSDLFLKNTIYIYIRPYTSGAVHFVLLICRNRQ